MLGSPQIYRDRNFSFRIYFNEGSEPPHVHVYRGDGSAKIWIDPISLCWNEGFNTNEMRWIFKKLKDRRAFFLREWYVTQSKTRQF